MKLGELLDKKNIKIKEIRIHSAVISEIDFTNYDIKSVVDINEFNYDTDDKTQVITNQSFDDYYFDVYHEDVIFKEGLSINELKEFLQDFIIEEAF